MVPSQPPGTDYMCVCACVDVCPCVCMYQQVPACVCVCVCACVFPGIECSSSMLDRMALLPQIIHTRSMQAVQARDTLSMEKSLSLPFLPLLFFLSRSLSFNCSHTHTYTDTQTTAGDNGVYVHSHHHHCAQKAKANRTKRPLTRRPDLCGNEVF